MSANLPIIEKSPDQKLAEQKTVSQTVEKTNDKPHKKIAAEVMFDKAVYGGISYAAQAAAGIVLLNWIKNGSGRRYFDKMADWIGTNFISKISSKKGKDAIAAADEWIVVTTMVMMGNAFIYPVKMLEDRKPKIVRWLNDKMNAKRESKGEFISDEEKAAQQKSLAELEKKPKQTWWSLGSARVFSLAAVYATLWGANHKGSAKNATTFNQKGEELFTKAITGTVDAVGLKAVAKSKTLENYLRIGFYDVFYSMVSAGGLYVYSHMICPPKKHKTAPACAETTQTTPIDAEIQNAEKQDKKHTDCIKPAAKPALAQAGFSGRLAQETATSSQPAL